jgi:phosphoribosylformylglycinamidine synthase II
MISRIYVMPKDGSNKADSYLIDSKLLQKELLTLAGALTNPILENCFVNKSPKVAKNNFTYAIEIGLLPGVTDNVGHTVKEIARDLIHTQRSSNLEVYTSKIFFISSTREHAENFASTLYNPLIESAHIVKINNGKFSFPLKAPKVTLKKNTPVINVLLNVSDEELIKISKEGIQDPTGSRRGPLALDLASMHAIKNYFNTLKRNPTDIEIESLAQTWSEHCKHTIFANPIDDITDGLYKTYIKGATNFIRAQKGKQDFCVSVFSDNAGGMVFDKDYLVTHKVETHNSPSALDPFGGAITGIVGVNRDTIGFGLGAKPVANTYGFCFGKPDDKKRFFRDQKLSQEMLLPNRIMEGVIKGINSGGNCSGIPTLSGFLRFDSRYRAKPMVFAGTVGLIPRKIKSRLSHEKRAKAGDYIVVVGGRVGLDGIHGATFSSIATDLNSPATAVQIGDPITQKKLSDAIVKEARDMNLYNSITDNGAGGISCSVAEMAKESGGAIVTLDRVPLKYTGLRPWEIWISESQERMTLSIPKDKWKKFNELMQRRGVEATIIGEFTKQPKIIVKWKGKKIVDMSMDFLHDGLPKHHLETVYVKNNFPEPEIPKTTSLNKTLESLLESLNLSGTAFVSEQYDHEVQASSVLKPLSGRGRINTDAQVFKPVLSSNKGVVLSEALYPSYSDLSTYDMAASALDTAVRNSIACGGKMSHLAILDNFCWCSSDDKVRLGELVGAIKACYDYAVGYGTPFISGKDSMFNDFNGYDEKGNKVKISIPPTLLISTIGVLPDIYKTVSPEFKNPNDTVFLLGETNEELGASEYFKMLGTLGNNVPKVNLEKNLKTYKILEQAIEQELLESSISVNHGGLGIALAKASIGGMLGCSISLRNLAGEASGPEAKLFSESQGRILVSVSSKNLSAFKKLCGEISCNELGKVKKDGKFVIVDGKKKVIDTNMKKLHTAYHKFSNKMK